MVKKYNIPESLLSKVQKIMRMENDEFEEYLKTLLEECKAYSKGLLLVDYDKLDNSIKEILNTFYMQYALYAKIEKDEISQDKLVILNHYISGLNSKEEKIKSENKNKVNFL